MARARALPCFTSSHFTTDTCSLYTQTEDINDEDCSSLYLSEPITETAAGDPVQKSSLVTGVAATAKEQLEKSLLVTGRIEHKTLHHKPSSAAQKTTAQTATDP